MTDVLFAGDRQELVTSRLRFATERDRRHFGNGVCEDGNQRRRYTTPGTEGDIKPEDAQSKKAISIEVR
jgi:hypothetical protein